jgi:hypothetical protein
MRTCKSLALPQQLPGNNVVSHPRAPLLWLICTWDQGMSVLTDKQECQQRAHSHGARDG